MDLPANAGACTGNLSCALPGHAQLAQPHAAAADGLESANGLREAVWRQRQHRPRRSRAAIKQHKSILDSVNGKLAGLKQELGPQDQSKVDEYTDAVRDVERRIQMAEQHGSIELPALEEPLGAPPVSKITWR